MKATSLIALLCGTFVITYAPLSRAVDPPVSDEIKTLIRELNDSHINIRNNASEKLVQMGEAAVPALKEAAKSNDPEIRARAQAALYCIQNPQKDPPQAAPQNPPQNTQPNNAPAAPAPPVPAGPAPQIKSSVVNGVKIIDVVDGARKTHIESDAHGIVMKVTEPKDGENMTTEYQGKNSQDLQKNSPDAFAIYDKYTKLLPREKPRRMGLIEQMEAELQAMGVDDNEGEIDDAREAAEVRQLLRSGLLPRSFNNELRAALDRWEQKQGIQKQAAVDEKMLQDDVKNLMNSLKELDPNLEKIQDRK